MRQYLFLRAYMAGILAPTAFSMVVYWGVAVAASLSPSALPPPERTILFPFVVVPNLWGIWNGIWAVSKKRLPLAAHGAVLPVINFGLYLFFARMTGIAIDTGSMRMAPMGAVISIVLYYLAWKYLVAFLNTLVDVD
jgi:hypothetical protein